jgi:hypothetical protein
MTDIQLKMCKSCLNLLPETKFKLRASTGRQAGQRSSMCNRCLYVKYTRPEAQRKADEIHSYQLEKGCADCGYTLHAAALEFDHLPGTKKLFNIGEKMGSYSRTILWEEIAKCDVVCANCHSIRTFNRRKKVEIDA